MLVPPRTIAIKKKVMDLYKRDNWTLFYLNVRENGIKISRKRNFKKTCIYSLPLIGNILSVLFIITL